MALANKNIKDSEEVNKAKTAQTSLLTAALNKFGSSGEGMIMVFKHRFQSDIQKDKETREEPTEWEDFKDQPLTDLQIELKKQLLEKWKDIKLIIKRQLLNPEELWKDILGGKEHRERKMLESMDIQESIDPLAGIWKEVYETKKSSIPPDNFGKFKNLFEKIERMRSSAFEEGKLSQKETEWIQKFYSIRDEFTSAINQGNQELENDAKKKFQETLTKIVSQLPPEGHSNLKIQLEMGVDSKSVLKEELDKVFKELESLENSINA